jgi:hypothetical protein
VGLLKVKVRRWNLLDGSEPPGVTRARDEATQRVASSWHIRCPIEGTRHSQASYPSPEQEVSFTPFVWAGIELSRFSTKIIRERRIKPLDPDLTQGGGISPCLVLWRGTCTAWLSPPNDDLGSTKILTRHYSAQSQTVNQLESSGTMLTCKFP